ncbi:MAG: hypothetical protein IT355_14255 [Gemmatimonadaceae bacterium]|nr:hypothetical protein [Gemmatimonadaceae bacterium]
MYTACLYCSHALGTNAVIEEFPIGRRLAFDGAKGRLWVVCPSCQRWCLVPIEERWEAIERCERTFRDARLRASTDEIGLVRVREGLELVRIGAPLLPELSAWRYGREYSARRRKAIAVGLTAAGVAAAGGALAVGTGVAGAWFGLLAMGVTPVIHVTALGGFALYSAIDSARAVELTHRGKRLVVYAADLRQTHLVAGTDGAGWGLYLRHSYGHLELSGDDAARMTARLLARANGAGAAGHMVSSAVRRLVESPSLAAFLAEHAAYSTTLAADFAERKREWNRAMDRNAFTAGKFDETANPAGLSRLAPPLRLALEMALHDASERVALSGELAPLLTAWREAEEIAGIADTLLVPPAVAASLERLQRRRTGDPSR